MQGNLWQELVPFGCRDWLAARRGVGQRFLLEKEGELGKK